MLVRLSSDVTIEESRVISVTESGGDAIVKLTTDGAAVESVTVSSQTADDVTDRLEEARRGNRN